MVTYNRSDTSTSSVIHDNPQFRAFKKTSIIRRYVLRPSVCKLREQGNLFLNIVDIVLFRVEIQDLDGHNLPCLVIDTCGHIS